MGLDMYLSQRFYVKNWDHMSEEQLTKITVEKGDKPIPGLDIKQISYITTEAMYWRKANSIHAWFVENVQGGKDECQESWVSHEKLAELNSIIKRVLESTKLIDGEVATSYSFKEVDGEQKMVPNLEPGKVLEDTSVAEELLPTSSGFFFGSTEYDQWYWEDLQRTHQELTKLLKGSPHGEFYYQASW